jgi:hypothetical protein
MHYLAGVAEDWPGERDTGSLQFAGGTDAAPSWLCQRLGPQPANVTTLAMSRIPT